MASHLPFDSPLFVDLPAALDLMSREPDAEALDDSASGSAAASTASLGGKVPKSAVAAVSKRQRDKKRKELEDLKRENASLKEEREKFLAKIDDLTFRVQEMRDKDSFDDQIENELLKAQLEEHRSFVQGLMRMASGVPSTADEKRRLYSQGADFAAAQVLALLTRSAKHVSEWTRANVAPQVLAQFPRGTTFDVCYQIISEPDRRMHIRTNQTIPGTRAKDLAAQYWSLWTSEDALQALYRAGGFQVKEEDQVKMSTQFIDEIPGGQSEKLATLMQKEAANENGPTSVYVGSQRPTDITRGVLLPASFATPSEGEEPNLQPWKRITVILSSRSTSINLMGKQAAPVYVEGSVTWDSEAGGTLATIVSVPENFKMGMHHGFSDFINLEDNSVSPKLLGFAFAFIRMLQGADASAGDAASAADAAGGGGAAAAGAAASAAPLSPRAQDDESHRSKRSRRKRES